MKDQQKASGCLGFLLKRLGVSSGDGSSGRREPQLPYHLRDKFLSPAELSFYHVLTQAVGSNYAINNKVRLWDILYVPRRDDSRSYENKISSKHIDFLLCDPTTMQPVLAVELDDTSHNRKERQERDKFVNDAFAAAKLPILHIKTARSYPIASIQRQIADAIPHAASTTPAFPPPSVAAKPSASEASTPPCPKCQTSMVQRNATKGKNTGKRFWACANYPNCRSIIPID